MNYWAAKKINSSLGFPFIRISPAPPDITEKQTPASLFAGSPGSDGKRTGQGRDGNNKLPGCCGRDPDFFFIAFQKVGIKV